MQHSSLQTFVAETICGLHILKLITDEGVLPFSPEQIHREGTFEEQGEPLIPTIEPTAAEQHAPLPVQVRLSKTCSCLTKFGGFAVPGLSHHLKPIASCKTMKIEEILSHHRDLQFCCCPSSYHQSDGNWSGSFQLILLMASMQ